MNSFSVIQGGEMLWRWREGTIFICNDAPYYDQVFTLVPGPGDGSKDFNYCRTSSQHPGLPSKGSTGSSASNFPLHLEDLG